MYFDASRAGGYRNGYFVDQSRPQMPAPAFPSRPVSELVTPETYGQESANGFSYLWLYAMDVDTGGQRSARTCGAVADERGRGTQPIDGTDVISAKWAYFSKVN